MCFAISEGCLLKPKARSTNLKPISSRSQLEPCNSSREESMLTHESSAVSKPTRQRSEQSRGRPAAEGAKALSEALREGGAQDNAPRG